MFGCPPAARVLYGGLPWRQPAAAPRVTPRVWKLTHCSACLVLLVPLTHPQDCLSDRSTRSFTSLSINSTNRLSRAPSMRSRASITSLERARIQSGSPDVLGRCRNTPPFGACVRLMLGYCLLSPSFCLLHVQSALLPVLFVVVRKCPHQHLKLPAHRYVFSPSVLVYVACRTFSAADSSSGSMIAQMRGHARMPSDTSSRSFITLPDDRASLSASLSGSIQSQSRRAEVSIATCRVASSLRTWGRPRAANGADAGAAPALSGCASLGGK